MVSGLRVRIFFSILAWKHKQFVYLPFWFLKSICDVDEAMITHKLTSQNSTIKKYEKKKINLYIFWLPTWSLYRNLAIFLDFFGFPWTFLPTCSWKLKFKNYDSMLVALAQIIYSLILTLLKFYFSRRPIFLKENEIVFEIFLNIYFN
jgi:hypothetical protein